MRQYIEPVRATRRLDSLPTSAALALPSLCAVCHGWDRQRVCGDCVLRFAPALPRCRRCALEVPEGAALRGACITDPPPFDATLAATTYGYPWDRLIAAFKCHAALDLAAALARLLVRAHEAGAGPAPTLRLPVALSRERLRERGYNQAWELARRLGRTLHCRPMSAFSCASRTRRISSRSPRIDAPRTCAAHSPWNRAAAPKCAAGTSPSSTT